MALLGVRIRFSQPRAHLYRTIGPQRGMMTKLRGISVELTFLAKGDDSCVGAIQ
jgi:hypothetical protein